MHTNYEGIYFRNNASQHFVSAKLSYEWGAFMPRCKSGSSDSGKAVAYEAYDASLEPVAAAETSTEPVAVSEPKKKKSAGGFASWLARKAR